MNKRRELIILIHGFFRTRHDMAFLARFFEKNGYDVFRPNLPTSFSTLEQCTERLERKLQAMLLDGQRLHFVGHSMGGLIIRQSYNFV